MRVPRYLPVALVAGVLLLVVSTLMVVRTQDSVEWIVSLVPTSLYIDQPAVFKAYAHDPVNLVMYHVRCNIVVTNATDIVLYDRVEGSPAVKTYTFSSEGVYNFRAFCTSEVDPETVYTFSETVIVSYPTPTVEVTPRWSRSLNVTIKTPYPYTNYQVTVVYGGAEYTALLQNGVARFSLPPIMKPETLVVVFLGRENAYHLVPELPRVEVVASADAVKAGSAFTVRVELVDDIGVINYTYPVRLTAVGDCLLPPPPHYTNVTYNVQTIIEPFNWTCLIQAEVEPWSGAVVFGSKVIMLVPQVIVRHEFTVANTTSWNYTFASAVELDYPANGTLTLYLNGEPVAESTGVTTVFTVNYSATLKPGVYVVRAVFRYLRSEFVVGDKTIVVPKYPYTIIPPDPVIYAGDDIVVPNADYYVVYRNATIIVIRAVFPGNEEYERASEVFVIRVVYPRIELTETSVRIESGAPGSSLEVFCKLGNRTVKIVELYLRTGNASTVFQPWIDCEYVYAVYRYKSYEQIMLANEPEPVVVLTRTCRAGEPCLLLLPSTKIISARIGTVTYVPGEAVRLPAGVYTLTVYLTDGNVLEYTVYVSDVSVKVYAWFDGTAWRVRVEGPPWARVKITLASGLTLDVGVGTHVLFSEPVSAYWQYGRVEFVKYALVR